MKKKVCKNCRLFVDGDECPLCKANQFSQSWQGRIAVVNVSKSEIAKKMGIAADGEYAIKLR